MHPLVRDAYKRLLWVGRDYPKGLAYVRERAKAGFVKNASLDAGMNNAELLKAVNAARWWAKELEGVVQLRKYRAMRQRYGGGPAAEAAAAELEGRYASGAAAPPPPPHHE
jgi:hypothetical protein